MLRAKPLIHDVGFEKMKYISLSILLCFVAGCASFASDKKHGAKSMIDPRCNLDRQKRYVCLSVHRLNSQANWLVVDLTNRKHVWELKDYPSSYSSTEDLKENPHAYFKMRKGQITIGTSGWFRIVTHSMHHERDWNAVQVGDLSIGKNHLGEFYYSRQHVCGSHAFTVSTNRCFKDMQDLLSHNSSWKFIKDIDKWYMDPDEASRLISEDLLIEKQKKDSLQRSLTNRLEEIIIEL